MVLSPMLNPRGTLIGDFTLAKLGPERFLILGSGPAEAYHMRWFRQHMPADGVSLRSLRTELMGLSIAGPKARELLSRVTTEDVGNEAFRFMAIRPMEIGLAPALVGRITFTGDLGYEIWMKPDYQLAIYDALLEAGEGLGLRHFGGRALDSLRLEKGFGSFTREYTPDYTPFEAGLERFVDLRKNDFIGRDALIEEQTRRAGPQAGDLQGRRERRGRARQRAGALRRRGGRVGDIRRLLPPPGREHRARLRTERARGARGRVPHRDPGRDARCGHPAGAALRPRWASNAQLTTSALRALRETRPDARKTDSLNWIRNI